MPDEAEAFVATLPVVKFHRVGPKTAAKMHALGIETGADLRSRTLTLQGDFGKSGSWYYEISRGREHRPVRPDRERKSLAIVLRRMDAVGTGARRTGGAQQNSRP